MKYMYHLLLIASLFFTGGVLWGLSACWTGSNEEVWLRIGMAFSGYSIVFFFVLLGFFTGRLLLFNVNCSFNSHRHLFSHVELVRTNLFQAQLKRMTMYRYT